MPGASNERPTGGRFGEYKEAFKLYEDGKHRRYELLFAVNGGALAIAKLFSDANASRFLGNLSLDAVAHGLAGEKPSPSASQIEPA